MRTARLLALLVAALALTAGLAAGAAMAGPDAKAPVRKVAPKKAAPKKQAVPARKAQPRRRLAGSGLLPNGGFESSLAGWYGWNSQLSRVAGGAGGASAARVTSTTSSAFSITTSPKPVTSTTQGRLYAAGGSARSNRPGSQLCLRLREWSGGAVAGSAQTCLVSTAAWQRFPAIAYTARGSGRQLDLYVHDVNGSGGDNFDVDDLSLTDGTAPPPPPPPPPAASLVAVGVDHAHVGLSWPLVAGASSYRAYRGAMLLGTTSEPTFTDALLWPATSYSYRVEAVSADGAVISTATVTGATTLLPASGFPRFFGATSFWNTRVGAAAVHPRSDGMIAYFVGKVRTPNFAISDWSVSVAEAHPSDTAYTVPCTMWACTLGAFGAIRIPVTAKPAAADDGHLAVYDPATQREWSFWQARTTGSSWSGSCGAAVSMAGNGVAPKGTCGANAANFPLLGGLIRPEEIAQGRIDHALVFGMSGVGAGAPVCPATKNAGSSTDPNALREGQKLQLDPSLDVDSLAIPAWQKTIARAMQEYGLYLRDGSGSLAIYGENTIGRGYDAWAKVGIAGGYPSLAGIPWSKLRVLDAPDC